ncbi:MAG: AI-2E family transporter YdiK [Ignavibacteriaceae bacterium]|nr:AI-2E family transporter YdiK [Ignavibacteriaceae bacterium]
MDSDLSKRDLTQITIGVVFILLMIVGSIWVFMPFVAALLWATIIVISTYNFMLNLQKRLWNKRGLAITVMLLLILAVIIIPIMVVVGAIIVNASDIRGWFSTLSDLRVQPAPEWFSEVPIVGSQLVDGWNQISSMHNEEIIKRIIPFLDDVVKWFVAQAGGFGLFMIHFLITVIICGILYSKGEVAVTGIRKFAVRLAGQRGDEIVTLAGQAIKAVTMGVVITALIQSILGGLALWICGVPRPGLLTAIMFILGLTQIGAGPVLIPAVIWKFVSGDPVWGAVLLVLTIIVGGSDNFIRPFLIKRGADLPILLIFAGVIGGLIAFGIVGLFIGPVILAVTYTLLKAWVNERKNDTGLDAVTGQ